jgi:putative SOS response-associated peptidase YedK
MCSRYELNEAPNILAKRFGLRWLLPMAPKGEVRPTNRSLVIQAEPGGAREAAQLPWGLAVSWDSKPLINARAETLVERKTFRPYLDQRCLVPATGYFEWMRDGRRRIKYRIAPQQSAAFAFAGLIGEGAFAIITCQPEASIGHIHDRMPVILDPQAESAWIDPATPFEAVAPLLIPYRGGPLSAETMQAPDPQGDLFA